MNNCQVSIVTISKNNYQGLQKTLESVKEQDYKIIEHIVIDGDSADGSKAFLDSYTHSKNYIYLSELDNGISSAFNKGLQKSNGDLIFFLNAGDVFFSKTVISEVVQSYMQHKWKCAIGVTVTTSFAGETIFYRPPQLSSKFLKYFMFLPHQGFFCETSLHKNYKYNESLKISMDYELFLRMLKNITIFYLPTVISIREPGGISSQTQKRISEHSQIRLIYANKIHEKLIISILNALILLKNYLKIDSPFASKNE
ncbi:glycosyltransferase family 2 protein [Nostoc sp. DedSLP04]|uniref:glycosyltransferase family 2 protein n=1 Tax=Nostoc sp. DedSLP04 TaxID=3075401 RepID=UPI002AD385DB|nr:glycosyltransferase family 2 protein [Nostoc sp. DedSLP04]MDZ8033132.1 glycosyltransferase family 2 protein [Nostoc sp. DedSLP04]